METTREKERRKRNKCNQLKRNYQNAELSFQSALNSMNKLNDEAEQLRDEIEQMERDLETILRDTSLDLVMGRKSLIPPPVSIAKGGAESLSIRLEINRKSRELSTIVELQRQQWDYAQEKKQEMNRWEDKITQNDCL